MKDESIVFVKAKTFHSGEIKLGVLLPIANNGEYWMKFLYFNNVLNRLDWICDIIHRNSIVVIRKRVKTQYVLF